MRKCPRCGALTEEDSAFCTYCGEDIGAAMAMPPTVLACPTCGRSIPPETGECPHCAKRAPAAEYRAPPRAAKIRQCVACGRQIGWHANVCPFCGYDYRVTKSRTPASAWPRDRMEAAGSLFVASGVSAIVMALVFSQELICAVPVAVLGVLAMYGGYIGAKRKEKNLLLTAGICGMLGFGFLIGAVLAFIGFTMLFQSRESIWGPPP